MRVGVHLPQYGRVAGPDAMTRAARHAEELGFADVWVSDHIVHPGAQSYPSPYLLDPLVAPHVGGGRDRPHRAGDERPRRAHAQSARIGQRAGQPRCPLGRPPDRGRGCRMVGGGVHGPGLRLPQPRGAARRGGGPVPPGLVRGPAHLPRPFHLRRRPPGPPAAGPADSDLDRREQRARLPAGCDAGRRLPGGGAGRRAGGPGRRAHPT